MRLFYSCQSLPAQQSRSTNQTNSLIYDFTILNPGYQKSDSSFAINNTTRYNRSRYDTSPRVELISSNAGLMTNTIDRLQRSQP